MPATTVRCSMACSCWLLSGSRDWENQKIVTQTGNASSHALCFSIANRVSVSTTKKPKCAVSLSSKPILGSFVVWYRTLRTVTAKNRWWYAVLFKWYACTTMVAKRQEVRWSIIVRFTIFIQKYIKYKNQSNGGGPDWWRNLCPLLWKWLL